MNVYIYTGYTFGLKANMYMWVDYDGPQLHSNNENQLTNILFELV